MKDRDVGGVHVHVPSSSDKYENLYNGEKYTLKTWLYDCVIGLMNILFTIFFREIKIRGEHKMPEQGVPTLVVCAPHANQFVDPSLVMVKTRRMAQGKRSRQVCFITAEVSLKKKLLGLFGRLTGAISVPRAQDNLKFVDKRIKIYAPDLDKEPRLIKGRVDGGGLDSSPGFTKFSAKSLIGLPNFLGNAQIENVIDDYTIVLKQPFKFQENTKIRKLLETGTSFKYASKIDNSKTFQNVFDHLHTRGCVGIFPEGGSHDRPSMLPLKAGVAIMALGAVAADPTMKVAVVPCGLYYFHREKFRSRAVMEYGDPLWVDGEMGKQYMENPREAVSQLLDRIASSLKLITENAPDFDTLMVIQAARRLYKPVVPRKTLTAVVEVNRRLLLGYSAYKNDPRVVKLKESVMAYNKLLYLMGLKDHQVVELKTKQSEQLRCFLTLTQRTIRLVVFFTLSMPGYILFLPTFIVCKVYAKKKAEEGLKKSLVKIKGMDLLATWKLLVALVLTPLLYNIYSVVLTWLYLRGNKLVTKFWVPSVHPMLIYCYFYMLLVLTTYSSLKTGEVGMDLFKSLPPLFVSLFYPDSKITQLKEMREELSDEITDVCNELGPKVFPKFKKIIESQYENNTSNNKLLIPKRTKSEDEIPQLRSRSSSATSIGSSLSNSLSAVNSRGSLADVPILSEGNHLDVYRNREEEEIELSLPADDKITSLTRQRRAHEKED